MSDFKHAVGARVTLDQTAGNGTVTVRDMRDHQSNDVTIAPYYQVTWDDGHPEAGCGDVWYREAALLCADPVDG